MRVLGLLDSAGAASVQAIQEALRAEGHEVAYTTVMTVLSRLHEKGVVTRSKDGRRHIYGLAKNAPSLTRGMISRIQQALFPQNRARPILALLDDEALSNDELRLLRKRIDERLKAKR